MEAGSDRVLRNDLAAGSSGACSDSQMGGNERLHGALPVFAIHRFLLDDGVGFSAYLEGFSGSPSLS